MDPTPDNKKGLSLAQLREVCRRYLWPGLVLIAAEVAFLICLYYILYPSRGYLHSDCTDSILWANATVESGQLFDPDFRYAAMLPFSSNLWYVPLIALFGMTMNVQLAGMVIFLVLFSAAVYFLCRSLRFGLTGTFGTLALTLLLLSGSDKLREILWGHVIYYSLAILMICLGLGLANRIMDQWDKQNRKGIAVYGALLLLLFMGNALNDLSLIVISTVPVLFAVLGERFFDGEHRLLSKRNLCAGAIAGGLAVATGLGLVLLKLLQNGKVANYASIYSMFSEPTTWFDNLSRLLLELLQLFGVTVVNQQLMFSADSLPDLLLMAAGLTVMILPIVGLVRYKKLRHRGTRHLLLAHVAESAVILLGYICGYFSTGNWRVVPMIGTAILASIAVLRECLADRGKFLQVRLSAAACLVLVLAAGVNAHAISQMPKDYGQDNHLHVLAQELEDRGLTYGYATFWNSQAITLLSDNQVKCRETLVTDQGIVTDYYQSSRKWYEDQPGVERYFVLLSSQELFTAQTSDHWHQITNDGSLIESFSVAGFEIFVFNRNVIQKGEFVG